VLRPRWPLARPAPIADAIGPPEQKIRAFEQIFGANQQVPHVGGCDKKWRQRRGAIWRAGQVTRDDFEHRRIVAKQHPRQGQLCLAECNKSHTGAKGY